MRGRIKRFAQGGTILAGTAAYDPDYAFYAEQMNLLGPYIQNTAPATRPAYYQPPAATGPGGRSFEQITGTAYLSPEERRWYLEEQARRAAAAGNTAEAARLRGLAAPPQTLKQPTAPPPPQQPTQHSLQQALNLDAARRGREAMQLQFDQAAQVGIEAPELAQSLMDRRNRLIAQGQQMNMLETANVPNTANQVAAVNALRQRMRDDAAILNQPGLSAFAEDRLRQRQAENMAALDYVNGTVRTPLLNQLGSLAGSAITGVEDAFKNIKFYRPPGAPGPGGRVPPSRPAFTAHDLLLNRNDWLVNQAGNVGAAAGRPLGLEGVGRFIGENFVPASGAELLLAPTGLGLAGDVTDVGRLALGAGRTIQRLGAPAARAAPRILETAGRYVTPSLGIETPRDRMGNILGGAKQSPIPRERITVTSADLTTRPDLFQARDVDPGKSYKESRVQQIVDTYDPGRMTPAAVIPDPDNPGKYIIYSGHHRTEVIDRLFGPDSPREVINAQGDVMDPEIRRRLRLEAIAENYTTAIPNVREDARAVERLREEGFTDAEIAGQLNVSLSRVEAIADLARLGPQVIDRVVVEKGLEGLATELGRGMRLYGISQEDAAGWFSRLAEGAKGERPTVGALRTTVDRFGGALAKTQPTAPVQPDIFGNLPEEQIKQARLIEEGRGGILAMLDANARAQTKLENQVRSVKTLQRGVGRLAESAPEARAEFDAVLDVAKRRQTDLEAEIARSNEDVMAAFRGGPEPATVRGEMGGMQEEGFRGEQGGMQGGMFAPADVQAPNIQIGMESAIPPPGTAADAGDDLTSQLEASLRALEEGRVPRRARPQSLQAAAAELGVETTHPRTGKPYTRGELSRRIQQARAARGADAPVSEETEALLEEMGHGSVRHPDGREVPATPENVEAAVRRALTPKTGPTGPDDVDPGELSINLDPQPDITPEEVGATIREAIADIVMDAKTGTGRPLLEGISVDEMDEVVDELLDEMEVIAAPGGADGTTPVLRVRMNPEGQPARNLSGAESPTAPRYTPEEQAAMRVEWRQKAERLAAEEAAQREEMRRILTGGAAPPTRPPETAAGSGMGGGEPPRLPSGRVPGGPFGQPPRKPSLPRRVRRQLGRTFKMGERPESFNLWNEIVGIIGLPQTALTMLDASFFGRQGAILGWAHPQDWGRMLADGLKAVSEEQADTIARTIRERPSFSRKNGARPGFGAVAKGENGRTVDVHFYEWGPRVPQSERVPGFTGISDSHVSRIATAGPGVGTSQRMYATGLNSQAMSAWERVSWMQERHGFGDARDIKFLDAYAKVINHARGYGGFDIFHILPGLNALFSGRNTVSRFQVLLDPLMQPGALWKASPRRLAAENLAGFIGGNMAFLGLLAATGSYAGGLWDVNFDPRSGDWGKIRIGNTTIDPWAGFGPIVRGIVRTALGEGKTQAGDLYDTDWKREWLNFFRNKQAPVPSLITEILTGEDYLGNKSPLADGISFDDFMDRASEMLIPFIVQDTVEAYMENEGGMRLPAAIAAGSLSFFGGGAQSYPPSIEMQLSDALADIPESMRRSATTGEVIDRWNQLSTVQQRAIIREYGGVFEELTAPEADQRITPSEEINTAVAADRTEAWETFKADGQGKSYRERMSEISREASIRFDQEYGDEEDREERSPDRQLIADFFDELDKAGTDYDERDRLETRFRAGLTPEQNQLIDDTLMTSADPNYERLKAARGYIDENYWQYRDELYEEMVLRTPEGSIARRFPTYDDLIEAANDRRPGQEAHAATARDVLGRAQSLLSEASEYRRVQDPKLDAMLYVYGYTESVLSPAALEAVKAWAAQNGVSMGTPSGRRPE